MTVRRPTTAQLQDIVLDLGMDMQAEILEQFRELMDGSIASYDVVDALPDEKPRSAISAHPRLPPVRRRK